MPMADYRDMGCEGYREALSARLDGEAEPVEPAQVDAHLASCAACRQWVDDAAAVTRLARTGPAGTGVDVTDAVLPAAPGRWRGRVGVALRAVLGALAVAQLVLGVVQATAMRPVQETHVHGSTIDGATPGHLWHESAAWNIAVGAAFLWVAGRRGRPVGILPILTVFIAVLALLSTADVLAGRVEPARLASHLFVLAGYLIVVVLARLSADPPSPGALWRAGRWQRVGLAVTDPGEREGSGVVRFPDPGRGQPAARTDQRWAA